MGRLTRAVIPSPAGRRGARADACDRHLAAVFGLAKEVTGDAGVAETLAADTFAALHHLGATPSDTLEACLLTDVHRRAVKWTRDDRIINGADTRAVTAASPLLATLPPDERDVVIDAYFGGRTYAEIAQQRGLDAAKVAELMQSGLRRLTSAK